MENDVQRQVPLVEKSMLASIIVPCFNEEATLRIFFKTLLDELKICEDKFSDIRFEVLFIDDGSTDKTREIIEQLYDAYPHLVSFLGFSRNFGKEAALTAGIANALGDVLIPIDADLQHPPAVIKELIERYKRGGVEVVVAKRRNRDTDSRMYKLFASLFYRIQKRFTDVKMPDGAGDFRLISRKVADALKSMPEGRRFMKGLFAWVGFPTDYVEFDVARRSLGKSHFNFPKLVSLAVGGLLDFSASPLRFSFIVGLSVSVGSFVYGLYIFFKTLILGKDTPGYASLSILLLFIGGMILLSLGIIGEYIWRIYMETKRRPAYVIEKQKNAVKNH